MILLFVIPTLITFGTLVIGTGALLADDAPKPANDALNKYFEKRA